MDELIHIIVVVGLVTGACAFFVIYPVLILRWLHHVANYEHLRVLWRMFEFVIFCHIVVQVGLMFDPGLICREPRL